MNKTFSLPSISNITSFDQDKFNFKIGSKNLAEILYNISTPNCFGVYGVWGSGKTSLMKLTQKTLTETYPDVLTIWFDAWKHEYDDKTPISFHLLFEIQSQSGNKKELNQILKNWFSLGTAIGQAGINLLGKASQLNIEVDFLEILKNSDDIKTNILTEYQRWRDIRNNFNEEFEKAIGKLLKNNSAKKIVVFIDDLDRCYFENSIKTLEAIKNFLNVKDIVYVIGVDRDVLTSLIDTKHGYEKGLGSLYLEKIIPYSVSVPNKGSIAVINELIEEYSIELEPRIIQLMSIYLDNHCYANKRIMRLIIHDFIMALRFINIEELQKALTMYHQIDFDNQNKVKLAIFRWCLIKKLKPEIFSRHNWTLHYTTLASSRDKRDPVISNIAHEHKDGDRVEPLTPKIDHQSVADTLDRYISESIFFES